MIGFYRLIQNFVKRDMTYATSGLTPLVFSVSTRTRGGYPALLLAVDAKANPINFHGQVVKDGKTIGVIWRFDGRRTEDRADVFDLDDAAPELSGVLHSDANAG